MSDSESRFQQLITKLKARDYRLTPQRAALLRLLAASEGHPERVSPVRANQGPVSDYQSGNRLQDA